MQRPPLFEANCFIYWKNRFETYVKSKDIDLWYIIAHGNYKPTIKDKDGKDVVTPYEKLDENQKKMLSKNDEAKMVLYNALPKKEYERIFIFNTIITSLKALDESFSIRNHVWKFLRALPSKLRPKVTAIEESKDLSNLSLDKLVGNLKVYEIVLEKDLEIAKNKKEKYKSLTTKARQVLSADDTSSSDSGMRKFAMAFRDFKIFFRRREASLTDNPMTTKRTSKNQGISIRLSEDGAIVERLKERRDLSHGSLKRGDNGFVLGSARAVTMHCLGVALLQQPPGLCSTPRYSYEPGGTRQWAELDPNFHRKRGVDGLGGEEGEDTRQFTGGWRGVYEVVRAILRGILVKFGMGDLCERRDCLLWFNELDVLKGYGLEGNWVGQSPTQSGEIGFLIRPVSSGAQMFLE
ncbi:hypothetical protein Tco_0939116 [Tanacetum coccineum]|uniref:DUF4219 domain-containing protein/UBN2 domain-containing protein n=1 Tax=Tanacetum coccineum TaxID=301880 RepID=A0ABQ5DJ43_9ASTR